MPVQYLTASDDDVGVKEAASETEGGGANFFIDFVSRENGTPGFAAVAFVIGSKARAAIVSDVLATSDHFLAASAQAEGGARLWESAICGTN